MTAPAKLTPGERRTLEALVDARRALGASLIGIVAPGGRRQICDRWRMLGRLKVQSVGDGPVWRLTAKGIAWARSLGFRVGSEEET